VWQREFLSGLRYLHSKLIDIFSMPHALNFYQFQFIHDFINNSIVAETNAEACCDPLNFSTP
jgi:hypothetical protein